ncbi:hypothetical protein [uncultured Bacteroides sp.]|uniref:VanZ family protein n=1 Tax=uncultured Bacteroides sp. TaxID=162156 RepID=UPI002AABF5B8|nr:hypothetical protein [uncultured Bacteroides sp.]
MIDKVRKYPLSILIVLTVIYLSFFKPPKTPLDQVKNFDKLVHVCMYLGLSGMLWLEYMKSHRGQFRIKHIFIGAVALPIVFSGCIELIQEYCTTYRGGDWFDFAANSVGVIVAGIIAYFFVKPKYF